MLIIKNNFNFNFRHIEYKTPIKALTQEVKRIIGKSSTIDTIARDVDMTISKFEEETKKSFDSRESKSIRYLLENRNPENHELTKRLLHWDPKVGLRNNKKRR